mgnify:CR=1 FL=1
MKKMIKKEMKVLVGIEVILFETVFIEDSGCNFDFNPCMGLKYNLYFSDGSTLSLWRRDDICPSGYEPCTYGCWEWTEGKKSSDRWGMEPLEVEVIEKEEGDYDDIVVSLQGSGDRVASVSRDGGDEYYPCGYTAFGFEGWYAEPKSIVWALRGLEDLKDGRSPILDEDFEANLALLPIREQCELRKEVLELKDAQDLEKRDQEKILVLGKEVSVSDVERHLKEGEKLIEIQFVN